MGVNKVIYYGEVLVDMSQVSVNPETLVSGETALDATGELITGQNPYEKNATDSEVNNQSDLLDQAIAALQGKAAGGGGEVSTPTQEKTVDITENGTHEVAPDEGYALSKVTANVNVPIPDGYIIPAGAKEITENGSHDVELYKTVDVNVPIPDGYIEPIGTLEVTENGTHDVTEYASVNVNVASSGGGTVNTGTCSVVITPSSNTNHYIYREAVTNGVIEYKLSRSYTNKDISITARCDSVFAVIATYVKSATVTGGEMLALISGQGVVLKAPAANGAEMKVTLGA